MEFNKDEIELIKSALVLLIDEFDKDIIKYTSRFPVVAIRLQRNKEECDNLLRRIKDENL